MRKLILLLFIPAYFIGCEQREEPEFPYPPAVYRTPICFPDDWQKSLVDHQGRLNYDFGPGPYARPKTEISVELEGHELKVVKQQLFDARVPIVMTELQADGISIKQEAFALTESWYPQGLPKEPNAGFPVKRTLGFTGAVGWAQPALEPCDPAFSNVAWGTGRPIPYSIAVTPGSRKRVALGFCDSYREKGKITRVMMLNVEGAPEKEIDLLVSGEQNDPQAFLFDARDINRDGQLDVEVRASTNTQDPNVLINVIWVFPEKYPVPLPDLIAGKLTASAEVYVDCGMEPQLLDLPQRRDAMIATIDGDGFTPVVRIKTNRPFEYDESSGLVKAFNRPFLMTQPAATSIEPTDDGWLLKMQPDIRRIGIVVLHGKTEESAESGFPDLAAERQATIDFWQNEAELPWDRLFVPDDRIQALIEGSVRTLYQVKEYVDGYPQFQPGPSVYRGFWASDGIWDADAAMLLGDFESAEYTVDRFINHQTASGRVEIMSPSLLHRETAHFMWLLQRYALLTQNKEWLGNHWRYMERAFEHYQQLRDRTLSDPEAPYFGLTPPGLTDGGIGGINAEYGGVYWGLIGMKSAYESARMLGRQEQSEEWQAEYDDFLHTFRQAAERDLQTDKNGNTFLPMKMAQDEEVKFPQRGQGQLLHTVFPGDIFGLDEPFVSGMFDIFDQNQAEGLILDTGWLKGGVWPFFAAHRGLAELWVGRTETAITRLDAFADHASPTLTWVEEQLPQDKGTKIAGDTPQTNASAQIVRLLRHLLILERGDSLHVLHGVPASWIKPDAELTFRGMPTMFGELYLHLEVSQDGNSATLSTDPVSSWQENNRLVISMQALKTNGFKFEIGEALPEQLIGDASKPLRFEFAK